MAASKVAAIPAVRAVLRKAQRAFAADPAGAVLDGRDIGTVICPDADVKVFVTASPAERARRRWLELEGRGEKVAFETVLADIEARDERDSNRSAAPLQVARDAHVLDTTTMDADAAFAAALAIVTGKAV